MTLISCHDGIIRRTIEDAYMARSEHDPFRLYQGTQVVERIMSNAF